MHLMPIRCSVFVTGQSWRLDCRSDFAARRSPSLKVGDFHMNRGFDSLKVVRKGGKKGSLAIHPQAAQRIRDYLDLAGHGDDMEGPLFRPVRDNRKGLEARRYLHPDVIDRILRKYARSIGLEQGILGAFDARYVYYHSAR